jgi:hypothetical protein
VSDYRIVVKRSPRRIRQKFYVVCVAANGETEWHSELYRDKDYAVSFGEKWAAITDGNLINST